MILINAGVARTATTWIEGVLFDLRNHLGLDWAPRGNASYLEDLATSGLRDRHIYVGVFLSWKDLRLESIRSPYCILHIRRDPRDLLISNYYALRYSHVQSQEVDVQRKVLQGLSEEEGLLHTAMLLSSSVNVMKTYIGKGPADRCLNVEFAEITRKPALFMKQYFRMAGLSCPAWRLWRTLRYRSFKNMSSGRAPGVEDVAHHFRKGVSGDWPRLFTPKVKERFKSLYGKTLIELGYESNLDW